MGQSYSGKIAFITGASSGIGAALARELARSGANLALVARRVERLEGLAVELRETGAKVLVLPGDVTKSDDLTHVVDLTRHELGHIDIVVANAGFGVVGKIEKLTLEDYRRQFETNVYGVIRTIHATLEDLKKTKGRLAIVGSVNGYLALSGSSAYGMSKFAVRALAESAGDELARYGISVTHIAPGFVATEIRKVDNEGKFHPHGRDEVPGWIQMPADKAAHQIARAILKRKREVVITGHGKFIVWLKRHFPGLVSRIVRAFGVSARPEP